MKIELADSIISIVDFVLPNPVQDKVLCISIDARVHDWKSQKEVSAIRGIHIAIYRPSNYIKVIMAIDNEHVPAFSFNKNLQFEFKSDHDSCWRDDGLRSPISKVACEMVDEIVKKGAKTKPFAVYSWFVGVSSINLVSGSIKVDRNDNYKVSLILD